MVTCMGVCTARVRGGWGWGDVGRGWGGSCACTLALCNGRAPPPAHTHKHPPPPPPPPSRADDTAPAQYVGSHYDTVVDGGRYDGALGIIVGISSIKALLLDVRGVGWVGGGVLVWTWRVGGSW